MTLETTEIPLPRLITLAEIGRRLALIFPESFPNRGMLTGVMARRSIFVFLYGGFIQGTGRFLRPAHIYLFTHKQAKMTTNLERNDWIRLSRTPKFRPPGKRWYTGDNSRETLRDDLIRNQLIRLGLVDKLSGMPGRSSKPTFSLSPSFASLFSPELRGNDLNLTIEDWRTRNLSRSMLQRMALIAEGLRARSGEYQVDMPDGSRIRLAAGPSSLLVRDLIEKFARAYLEQPAVIWLNEGESSALPIFERAASRVGLKFDSQDVKPDVVLVDLGSRSKFLFCEVVASDGPITDARRQELMRIAVRSNIDESAVEFLTAYESRSSPAFRKTFPTLDRNSFVWFRTEPEVIVQLRELEPTSPSGDNQDRP